MTRRALTRWIVAVSALAILGGCESIGSDTDGSTTLPVGTWIRTDGLSNESLVFSKDGSVQLDSLESAGGLRYLGTWSGSTASGTAVWKESSPQTASGKWGVPKPLVKLVPAPYAIDTKVLVMTFPDGPRRFSQPDTSGS